MELKIINQEKNIQVVLIEEEKELAMATCYFENTPKVNNKNIGCIGEFVCQDEKSGIEILKKCEEILKQQKISLIVAPMNGNTWKKYRTIKYTNGESLFLLENVNPIEHNEILKKAGFKELYTYTSTKGLIENAYQSEVLEKVKNDLKEKDITIRPFKKEKYQEELEKIYNISIKSFGRNPFYTPIEKNDFNKQYEQYISKIDEEFILIAEKEEKEIGFIFAIPNFNEIKEGKQLETLIVKTVAVLPEYQNLAIGNVLLSTIAKNAENKNFKKWIFAFMYSDNTSQKMAKRNKTEIIREYAIYGKEI